MLESILPIFSFRCFIVSGLMFRSLIHLTQSMSLFLCMVLESVLFHSFASGWPAFPAPLVKEIVFNPLYILASFVKDKVFIGVWVYLWAFHFVPLMYISIFVPVPYCLSWWLWLCNRAWSQAGWFLQFHSSFSRLLWLFEVFCISAGGLLTSLVTTSPTLCLHASCCG